MPIVSSTLGDFLVVLVPEKVLSNFLKHISNNYRQNKVQNAACFIRI